MSEMTDQLKREADRLAAVAKAAQAGYDAVQQRLNAVNEKMRLARPNDSRVYLNGLQQEKAAVLRDLTTAAGRLTTARREAAAAADKLNMAMAEVTRLDQSIADLESRLGPRGFHVQTIAKITGELAAAEASEATDKAALARLMEKRQSLEASDRLRKQPE